MTHIPEFDDYVATLERLTAHADPTADTSEAQEIKQAARSLAELNNISITALTGWAYQHPTWIHVLGLTAGLSQEKLKMALKHSFNTTGWATLARQQPEALVTMLDTEFDLVRLVASQRDRRYEFGDVLVARASTRRTATRAGVSGRKVEAEIEAIARNLNLEYQTRTRFSGRPGRDAPCDLVIPNTEHPEIVVAAKGFDSTGSKLTDAVTEIQTMAEVRRPRQFVLAVVDGIGWKSRISDLRSLYELWESQQIDGMYSLASLEQFRATLEDAARLRGLLDK